MDLVSFHSDSSEFLSFENDFARCTIGWEAEDTLFSKIVAKIQTRVKILKISCLKSTNHFEDPSFFFAE